MNTGTFISREPIGFEGGMNLYQYARNNPLKYRDLDGKIPVPLLVVGGATLAGAFSQGITTLIVTRDIRLTGEAFLAGAVTGFVAGVTAYFGKSTLIAAGAAVVVDAGISFMTGPSSINDPKDFIRGIDAFMNPRTPEEVIP